MNTLLLASVLLSGLLVPAAAKPNHAFCKTVWLFALPCPEVNAKLLEQIKTFSPEYKLISSTPANIEANHTGPDGLVGEHVGFTSRPSLGPGGCLMTGRSASVSFTRLLDAGVNYCNLHKLLMASGLNTAPGFEEMINEWACLSYAQATCDTA